MNRLQSLKSKRKSASQLKESKYYIVYFWKDDDLAFIGRNMSQDPDKYISEKIQKHNYTHFTLDYLESVSSDEVSNYLADEIFDLMPIDNQSIPKNTKYISAYTAKEKYRIDKREFKKVHKEHSGKQLGKTLYVEKQIFDDIYCMQPYHENMPKIGHEIVVMSRDEYHKKSYHVMGGGLQDYESGTDEEGNRVETYTTKYGSIDEQYGSLCDLLNNSYTVTELLDANTFIAETESQQSRKFSVDDYRTLWYSGVNEFTKEHIIREWEKDQRKGS